MTEYEEASVIEGIGGKELRCPKCDDHLYPVRDSDTLWNCNRCPFGPYVGPEGVEG